MPLREAAKKIKVPGERRKAKVQPEVRAAPLPEPAKPTLEAQPVAEVGALALTPPSVEVPAEAQTEIEPVHEAESLEAPVVGEQLPAEPQPEVAPPAATLTEAREAEAGEARSAEPEPQVEPAAEAEGACVLSVRRVAEAEGVRVLSVRRAVEEESMIPAAVSGPQLAPAPPAVRQRRFRIPRLKLRPASKLEGAELPLLPMRGEAVRVASGYLVMGDGVVRVYAEREGPWGPLQPLADYRETQEIFVSEQDGMVHVTAGIAGKRFEVELPRELVVERLAQRIAIEAGIPLSERNPQDSGEYHGWRVNLVIPQLAGGWQISAARVVKVEPLRSEPLLLARLVALAAAPNSLVFVGPPGSGKTTALIGVLNAVLELWPKLRVSIVEEEPEVAVQVSGPSVVRYFSFGERNVTANIRATRRYDRPDLLVVGELRGEEVPSWFEAAGSGIPVFTTAHSVGLADAIKRLDTLIQASGLKASVLDAVRVWVVCGKTVSSSGIERGVKAVYVVTEKGFQPVYKAGLHLPEEDFLQLLPPELQLALDGREASRVYEKTRERLGARGLGGVRFERLEPLPFEEVFQGEGL